jgi:hypothetical protein
MTKRSVFLMAAVGLLASSAFVTPSKAGSVNFTVQSVTGGGTITGVYAIGTPVATPPKLTISDVVAAGTQVALTGPPTPTITQGGATAFVVGNYSLTGLPINGALYTMDGSVNQSLTIKYGTGTGTITLNESINALVGHITTPFSYTNQGPIAPQVIATSTTVIGMEKFTAYYFATATVNNAASILVSLEATAVPEPTSMALLGIGMTSFLAFRRFFKRGVIA